jgi:polyisoprenoid-binding protein YceI
MTRSLALASALSLAFAASSSPARADDYELDNSHTSVIFGVSHMGYSFSYGRFNKVSGAYTLDPAKPEASTFAIAIDANSIDTNNADRDKHLKSPDFFSGGEFPVISFKSTKVAAKSADGGGVVYEVTGELTMHGVTKPLTLQLQKLGEGPGAGGQDYRSGFNCQTKLKRSEFGMTKMVGPIGDEVAITISFEGVRKGDAAKTGAKPSETVRR